MYPVHYLLSFGGTLHNTEQWAMGLRLRSNVGEEPTGGLSDGDQEDALDDLVGDVTAFVQSGIMSSEVRLDHVKFNKIGPDGRYVNQGATHARYLTGVLPNGGGALKYPPQVAVAVTLDTANSRGLAHRGRLFIPSPSALIQTDGIMQAPNQQSIGEAVQTFINNVNNWPGLDVGKFDGLDVHIVSNVREGAAHKVTGVRVGRVFDTQRRRRKSLDEQYGPLLPVS